MAVLDVHRRDVLANAAWTGATKDATGAASSHATCNTAQRFEAWGSALGLRVASEPRFVRATSPGTPAEARNTLLAVTRR